MKKVVFVFILLVGFALIAHTAYKMNPHTGKLDYYESALDNVGATHNHTGGNGGLIPTAGVLDNTLMNADVNDNAAIAASKLSGVELLTNKSDNTSLGTSATLYPTQNAVKVYADTKASAIHTQTAQYGGTEQNSSASTGTPYVLSGVWSFDDVATFMSRIWTGSGAYLKYDGTRGDPAGAGDFSGPASSTDNAVVIFNGTGGKTGKNSLVTIDNNGKVTAPGGYESGLSASIAGYIQLYELSGNGTNYVGFKSPDNVITTYQFILPPAPCTSGQSLRVLSDNVTLECYTPGASGGTKSFDMIYSAPSSSDNTAIKTIPVAVTITGIRGIFTDNTGTISVSASDNAAIQLSFCAPDNVVNCTSIDNTTIVGGTSVYADESMGGTPVVPAYSPIILKFGVVNTTKPLKITISYTEN